MIVVKLELHNANTGEVSEIGRAIIANIGGTDELGDYRVVVGEGSSRDVWSKPDRQGFVGRHQRLTAHVWHLVSKALAAVGHGSEAER